MAETTVPSQKASSNSLNAPERASRARQRLRLIDACISALHMHGPSRTTVEKVVALADMSPGIVRFYFDSKDAMLLASLAHLAAEFEERVMRPVAQLRQTPVRALEQLVELYLDAEVASPRKVSVWYSFWGEASSRQEYLEICGKKDDDFAALVRDLIERLIAQSGESHLDADAVALGLIGVLEVLWQSIAFMQESQIDRIAAKQRSLAYLRSVFPGQFARHADKAASASVPAWAYSDATLLGLEREQLFRPSWQIVGHEADIAAPGDFITVDLVGERALLVRDEKNRIRAFRNSCRKRPHAIVTAQRGHLGGQIACEIHGLSYDYQGNLRSGSTPGALTPLELALPGRFIFVQAPGADGGGTPAGDWMMLPDLLPQSAQDIEVSADWKLMVEQWLDALPRPRDVRREFLQPNQLLEIGSAGVLVLQVIPTAPGRCRLRQLTYTVAKGGKRRRGAAGATEPSLAWLRQDIQVAESMQSGLESGAPEADESAPASHELTEFRAQIAALVRQIAPAR